MTKTSIKLNKTQKETVEEIMNTFDFRKVREVMYALDWEWRDIGVPSVEEIRQQARSMLNRCVDLQGKNEEGSGGLRVEYDNDKSLQDYCLRLSFEVEEKTVISDKEQL